MRKYGTVSALGFGPNIAARARILEGSKESFDNVLHGRIDDILADLEKEQPIAEALTVLHRLQRYALVAQTGLGRNEAVIAALVDERNFPLWHDYKELAASEEQKDNLARLMYEGDPERQSPLMLNICDYSRGIAERIVRRCVDEKDECDVWIGDPLFHRRLLTQMDDDAAFAYGVAAAARFDDMARSITLRINDISFPFPDEKTENHVFYSKGFQQQRNVSKQKNPMYTVTEIPVPEDAVLDNIPYADYVDLYFRMCNVDWNEVDEAHRYLIAKLNSGSHLRFTNDDGTDLSMDITGFTFCNSRVARNVPGSEVFSAFHKTSLNGRMMAKGRFIPPNMGSDRLIEDITLDFKDGKVVSYHASTGLEFLKEAIETDEGSCYGGEIGIGTNPVLRTHLVNGLMVEKIGGSFHIALGRAYTYTDYLGDPVHVDNGNRSDLHWDITCMLYGKGGMMVLDNEVIIDNGRFADPALSYLNGEY